MAEESATEAGGIVMGPCNYGKSEVRVMKVTRNPGRHEIRDLNVAVTLEGDFEAAHTAGNNAGLLATDTMRNTIYALAQKHPVDSIEAFGAALVEHFLQAGPTVTGARVHIVEYPWNRIQVRGTDHPHCFTRASGERHTTVTGSAAGLHITAGIDNLLVLKTTESGWEGYLFEEYTTLPETNDRILCTMITAVWSYGGATGVDFNDTWQGVHDQILETFTDHYSPSVQNTLFRMGKAVLQRYSEVQNIRFSFPNKHHLLFDLSRFGLENKNEIFHVTSEPYGLIQGTVQRKR